MKLTLPLIALVLTLGACAGSKYDEARKYDRLRDYDAPDQGVAVISVGHAKSSIYTVSSASFRLTSTNDPGSFGYAPKLWTPSPKDFDSPDVEGTVLAVKLPPGHYEVIAAGGGWGAGSYRFSTRVEMRPPMSFTIETGRTAYLGRFLVGQDGSGPSSRATLDVTDEEAADLSVARSRNAIVNTQNARSFVPPPGARKF